MKNKLIILGMAALLASVAGADSMYKLAGGRVYSIYDGASWIIFGGLEVTTVLPGEEGLICRPYYMQEMSRTDIEATGTGAHAYTSTASHKVYTGQEIVLLHYLSGSALCPGSELADVKAVLVDSTLLTHGPASATTYNAPQSRDNVTYYNDLSTHSVYDCGVDYYPPVAPLTSAQALAAAKHKHALAVHTFHWLQKQATNGSISAASSLGVHYLNGDGTETNRVAGLYWLNLAATNGDLEASNTLAELSRTNAPVMTDDLAQ